MIGPGMAACEAARRRSPGQAGAVALELVLVAPLLALLVAAMLGATTLVTEQLVVERAARAVARAVALGGPAPGAPALGLASGSVVEVRRTTAVVEVVVTSTVELVGVRHRVVGRAAAPLEPSVP